MNLLETPIAGVFEAQTVPFADARGAFARLFCSSDLAPAHAGRPIAQINHSRTAHAGSIRGLHFQSAPYAEAKWVRCLRGRVFDVAVDLRHGSPTFLQWHAVELDAARMNALFIPEGCAHGFQALEEMSELLYLHTAPYAPQAEGGVRFDDPAIAIRWPLAEAGVSDRDRNHPLLEANFEGLRL